MTFTEFKNIVENFQQYLNKCSELYQEGINIYNSDLYKPIVSAFYDYLNQSSMKIEEILYIGI